MRLSESSRDTPFELLVKLAVDADAQFFGGAFSMRGSGIRRYR